MPYKKIKNLDNPLLLNGEKYQFIDFKFDQSDAKKVVNIYNKRWGITCKIFTIGVKSDFLKKSVGYAIYSTWKRKTL